MSFAVLALALLVDARFGYPTALFARIGHPVTWVGALIALLDRTLNKDWASATNRRVFGVAAVIVVVAVGIAAGLIVERLVLALPTVAAVAVLGVLVSSLVAQRSLHDHVAAVAIALENGDLAAARRAVAHIVGRDPNALDNAGAARAALESLGENFSDGVVAPAFWMAVGGVAGGVAYKAINTADSMIGYKTPRHLAFGWAAARLDDVANILPARLSALFIVAVAGRNAMHAWRTTLRDAAKHDSPNAGWPEAAMAGALGLALAGPRVYPDRVKSAAWMGDGRREATAADIRAGLALYRRACILQFAIVAGCAAMWLLLKA